MVSEFNNLIILAVTYRSPFDGKIITARALLAAALSNDFVKLRQQLQKRTEVQQAQPHYEACTCIHT